MNAFVAACIGLVLILIGGAGLNWATSGAIVFGLTCFAGIGIVVFATVEGVRNG